jgi:hypothetical protein
VIDTVGKKKEKNARHCVRVPIERKKERKKTFKKIVKKW